MAGINLTLFFTALGKLGKALNGINTFRGTTVPGYAAAIPGQTDFQTYPNVGAEAIDALNSFATGSQMKSVQAGLQTAADDLLLSVVNAYTGDTANTNVNTALAILCNTAVSELSSLQGPIGQNTVSSTLAQLATNSGNGTAVVSLFRDDGASLQFPLAEVLTVLCTNDSVQGRATLGQEQFTVVGQAAQKDTLASNYPQGSGVSVTLNSCDATAYNANNNLTTNGDFETWSGNTPANWAIISGTAGTEIAKETVNIYSGTASAKLVGGTGNNLILDQVFNNGTTGTPATLLTANQYAFNVYMKKSGTPTGHITIELWDKTNNVPTIDFNGQPNQFSIDVSTLSSSVWTAEQGIVITPKSFSANYALRIRCGNLTAGSIYVDHFGLNPMTQLYLNGPQVSVFSGSTPWSQAAGGDGWNLTVANNYSCQWCTMLQRLYDLNSQGLIMGHASSPSISDSLLT